MLLLWWKIPFEEPSELPPLRHSRGQAHPEVQVILPAARHLHGEDDQDDRARVQSLRQDVLSGEVDILLNSSHITVPIGYSDSTIGNEKMSL